ncbi:hypothetical protein PINS_up005514 [Pythium insidiosum]|nr:hypothetical protein PINS_up005514 [Pythium insidiosum]
MEAIRIRTAKQVQDEELKNLFYYRDECEHAWKAMHVCEERERDAVQIIDELKADIEELQQQVKALTSLTHVPLMPSPTRSADKGTIAVRDHDHDRDHCRHEMTPLLSFDEWKAATRVWTPPSDHKASTPHARALAADERSHEIARCISVPALLPTAMERATTALQSSCVRSPTRHEQQPSRRATTAIGRDRVPSELPAVSPNHSSTNKLRATTTAASSSSSSSNSPQRSRGGRC